MSFGGGSTKWRGVDPLRERQASGLGAAKAPQIPPQSLHRGVSGQRRGVHEAHIGLVGFYFY